MDADHYQMELIRAWVAGVVIEGMPLTAMLAAIGTAEAIGHFAMPPFRYQAQASKMDQDKRLLRALREVQQVLDQLRRENPDLPPRIAESGLGIKVG